MKQNGLFVTVAVVIILVDQITKALVRAFLPVNTSWPEEWLWRLTHIHNYGAAFGLFQNLGGVFMVIAIVAAGLIVYFYRRLPPNAWIVRLALGMQLGGAIGNLIDRLHQGYVTDFFDLRPYPYVFNIADSAIVGGVFLLAYYLLFVAKDDHPKATPPPSDEATAASI
ncbi:MAG: signal peptidase II, partial [Dehalococcoidia bacterium]|nr:signal peptidase II [Dehalococcoidia bacterium]